MPATPSPLLMALLLVGLLPLAFAADLPYLRGVTLIFDLLVVTAAAVDFVLSRRMLDDLRSERETGPRLAVGESREVRLSFENLGDSALRLTIRDEYPPEMRLDTARETAFTLPAKGTALFSYRVTPTRQGGYVFGRTAVRCLSRLRLVTIQRTVGEESLCEVFPNLGRARALELGALGAQSFVAVQRRAARRGEGREFESLRDYVLGDELRHISWTATARRSKLTTRQYQIERDQNVIVALDAGRMMTGVIDDETKFETALHAGLALMSAAARAGDNFGLVLFGRNIRKYVPPGKGVSQFDAVLEALYDAEPEPVEPSYARAFKFIAANTKRRSFIAVMTDLVDKDSSKELIASMKLLRPRHLPLVAAVADRDLSAVVSEAPEDARQMFVQSAAQEVIRQREAALRVIETQGGLTLDVTTRTLALNLLQKYLKVKERGLL